MRLLLVLVAVAVGCEGGGGSACDPVDDAGGPSLCWAKGQHKATKVPSMVVVNVPCQRSQVVYLNGAGCEPSAQEWWSLDIANYPGECIIVPDGCKSGLCFANLNTYGALCSADSDCPASHPTCRPFSSL